MYQNNNNGGGFAPRQFFKGSWKCSKCDGEITQLPFEPDPSRLNQLLCRDCHKQRMAEKEGR